MKVLVVCGFADICKNYKKECWRCSQNIALKIGNYFKTDEVEIFEAEIDD